MTARLPYFPFYPKDFASDGLVEAMTTAEVGCYVLLLCKAWHEDPTGTIPADDETLARWCRVSAETWANVKGRVLAPWKLGQDGRWHQGRMKAEADKAQESYAKRKNASDVANEKRWGPKRIPIASESDNNRTPVGRPSVSQSESESESDKNQNQTVAISCEGISDRMRMIESLVGCGLPHGRAVQVAGNPWLTPERLDYIIKLAVKKIPSGDRRGFIIAGIRDKYEDDPTAGKTPKVAEYKPPRFGALPC